MADRDSDRHPLDQDSEEALSSKTTVEDSSEAQTKPTRTSSESEEHTRTTATNSPTPDPTSTTSASPTTSSSSSSTEDADSSNDSTPTSTRARADNTSSSDENDATSSSASEETESSSRAQNSSTATSTDEDSSSVSASSSTRSRVSASSSSADSASSSFATLSRSASAVSSSDGLQAITASFDSPSASTSSDDDGGGGLALSTGPIIAIAVGGVVALCLVLAILGRGRFLVTKWTKRSQRDSRTASLALTPSPRDSMQEAHGSGYATLSDQHARSNAAGAGDPIDFSPTPLYPIQHAFAHRSSGSLHSRRTSARGLEFNQVQPADGGGLAAFQPAYPPMPHHPYRQHTFSEFGRAHSGTPSMLYAPGTPTQPWLDETKRASGSNVSLNSTAPMLPIPREPKRSSTMPMTYHRPESEAWTSVPIASAGAVEGLSPPSPATPRVATPSFVNQTPEARASMRASVYDALNRSSTRVSLVDPSLMPHAQ